MKRSGAIPFTLESMTGSALDATALVRLSNVVPDDSLRTKRLDNLKLARQVIVGLDGDIPVGLVYVRTIAGIPNVTWLVAERARRRGLAARMLTRLQEDWRCLTAICRNDASVAVARRAGFTLLGPFALWLRSAR